MSFDVFPCATPNSHMSPFKLMVSFKAFNIFKDLYQARSLKIS